MTKTHTRYIWCAICWRGSSRTKYITL